MSERDDELIRLNEAFMEAIRMDNPARVREALAAGADPLCLSRKKWGAMAVAAREASPAAAAALVELGFSATSPGLAGNHPIHFCCANDSPETLRFFLGQGANPNELNDAGMTPLMYAIASRQERMAAELIKAGADIHLGEENGWLPLARALQERGSRMVDLLLDAGADPFRSAGVAQSAMALARSMMAQRQLYPNLDPDPPSAGLLRVLDWERANIANEAGPASAPSRGLRV